MLPAWDEITGSEDWKRLTLEEKRKVYNGYLADLGETKSWQILAPDEKNILIRAMQTDAGPEFQPSPAAIEDTFSVAPGPVGGSIDIPAIKEFIVEHGGPALSPAADEPVAAARRPPGIYPAPAPQKGLLSKAVEGLAKLLGRGVPLVEEKGLSEEAKAQALIEHLAGEEGVPLAEYRESPEFIEQFAQGFTDVASFGLLPALEKAFKGKKPILSTSIKGKFGSGLGSFAGLLFGPAKGMHKVTAPIVKRLPQVAAEEQAASRLLKQGLRESVSLGPVIGAAETGRALEKRTFRQAAADIVKASESGALTGAIFGFTRGLFPKEVQQRAQRIVTGWVILNAQRIVEDPNHAGPWDRPLEDVIYDTIMDTYFMWRGIPGKQFEELDQKITEEITRPPSAKSPEVPKPEVKPAKPTSPPEEVTPQYAGPERRVDLERDRAKEPKKPPIDLQKRKEVRAAPGTEKPPKGVTPATPPGTRVRTPDGKIGELNQSPAGKYAWVRFASQKPGVKADLESYPNEELEIIRPGQEVRPAAAEHKPTETGVIPFKERSDEEKRIIEAYNKKMSPEEWEKEYEKMGEPHYAEEEEHSPLADELISDLKREGTTKARILEIGVGNGRDSIYLAKKGHIVKGIDIVQKAIERAKEKTKDIQNVEFEVGNAEDLKFEPESFDAVYSVAALHSTPIRFTFREIYRVLKPGGQAKLFLYTRTKTGDKWVSYWTPGEIKQFAEEEGLKVEKFREGHDKEPIEIPGVEGKVEQETYLVVTTLRKPKGEEKKPIPKKPVPVGTEEKMAPEDLGRLNLKDVQLQEEPIVQIKKLAELIDHPQLFETYPDMKDMRVEILYHRQFRRPHGTTGAGHIEVSAGNEADLRDVLAHEIQHQLDKQLDKQLEKVQQEKRAERAGKKARSKVLGKILEEEPVPRRPGPAKPTAVKKAYSDEAGRNVIELPNGTKLLEGIDSRGEVYYDLEGRWEGLKEAGFDPVTFTINKEKAARYFRAHGLTQPKTQKGEKPSEVKEVKPKVQEQPETWKSEADFIKKEAGKYRPHGYDEFKAKLAAHYGSEEALSKIAKDIELRNVFVEAQEEQKRIVEEEKKAREKLGIKLWGTEKEIFADVKVKDLADVLRDQPWIAEGEEVTIDGEKYIAYWLRTQAPKVKEFKTLGGKKRRVPEIEYQEFERVSDGETLLLSGEEVWNKLRLPPDKKQKKLKLEPKKPLPKAEKVTKLEVEEGYGEPGQIRPTRPRTLEKAPAQHGRGPQEKRPVIPGPPRTGGEGKEHHGRADIERAPAPRGVGAREGADTPSERRRPPKSQRDRSTLDREEQPTETGNYRITEKDTLEQGGEVTKYERNIAAIKLLKRLESENRLATPEEQAALVQYSGWGGLPDAFLPGWRDTKWAKRAEALRDLLTDEEYEAARASTPNAHYTSPLVIKKIYDALDRMGFRGGRVLEPSMGIGHFFGLIPERWRTKLTGIEIDSISSRIARQLYQSADVRMEGYEEAKLPDNFFDIAVSNVPFGDYRVYDPRYNKLKFNIHDYFFAKTLDKVRPDGLLAFITSSGTMDKLDQRARQYIRERAELLAAVRLPNNAFKGVANTEVTTDILFLRKLKPGEKPKGPRWMESKPMQVKEEGYTLTFRVNEYYHRYPHMMLGKVVRDKLHWDRAGLESDGRDLGEALGKIIEEHIPRDIYEVPKHKPTEAPPTNEMVPAPDEVKAYGFFEKQGRIYQKSPAAVEGEFEATAIELSKTDQAKMRGFFQMREAVRTAFRNQLEGKDEELQRDLKRLNKAYDRFVKKHGYLHTPANARLFQEDPDHPLLLSLEKWDPETKTATKTDVFRKRVMARYQPVEKADTAEEALVATLFDRGRVDFEHMERISGKTAERLEEELTGLIYRDPEGGEWVTADEYLSGNVRHKLKAAQGAARVDKRFEANVKALEKVQPEDLKPSEIDARLGSNWVPEEDITAFIHELLKGEGLSVRYVPETAQWIIDKAPYHYLSDVQNTQKWGSGEAPALKLIEDALNLRQTRVYKTVYEDGQEKRILDPDATAAAQAKQQEIKDHFRKWIWEDKDRRDRLVRKYNDQFNNIRLRKFDGSHIDRLPGASRAVELRPHQKDAVWRIIHGRNTLLAHVVGSGKTFTMVSAAMELRRLGLAKKPLITVPKHLIEQWKQDFLSLYPAAKILVPTEKDFTPAKRQEFMSRIATGDWDAVIVTHDQFGKLPMSKKAQNDFIRQQIEDLENAVARERQYDKKSKTVKELEKAKKRLVAKLRVRMEQGEKDETITFEELGVDYLFVDESHKFKNLWFATRMTRVAGLPNTEAARATDMFLKTQYLNNLNNNRGIVFATGTPIANTMAEMFTIERYMDMDGLRELDIHNFDAWAGNFGEVTTGFEVTPTGAGYRVNSRFNKFVNLPELQNLFRSFADVILAEDVKLPVPEIKGRKPQGVSAPPRPELEAFVEELVQRVERIKKGDVDPTEDNMLKVTTDGRKAALDMRLIDPTLPDDPDSKVNRMVESVLDIYKRTNNDRSTQLIFCDFSKPEKGKFNIYDDVKKKLIRGGIPEKEIAFIHDAKNDADKLKLFENMNKGKVRVLMGSTWKMGEGMNAQRKLIALHDLDAPWRPADIEQRLGRIQRQGNENEEIEVYRYVTKGSFDAYMWQTLESKARFIAQIMKGEAGMRTAEDVEAVTLTYAEVKAITSGNPAVMEKVKADAELRTLKAIKSQWEDSQREMKARLDVLPKTIRAAEESIERLKKDIRTRDNNTKEKKFEITLEGKTYTERDKARDPLLAILKPGERDASEEKKIGEYRGFELLHKSLPATDTPNRLLISGEDRYVLRLKAIAEYADEDRAASAYLRALDRELDGFENLLKPHEQSLEIERIRLEETKKEVGKPFEKEDRLREVEQRAAQLAAELAAYEKPGQPQAPARGEVEASVLAERAGVEMPKKVPLAKEIPRRSQIIREMGDRLEIPIRTGKFRKKKGMMGIFKPREKVIRLKYSNDVEVAVHEIGHRVQDLLALPKRMPREVMDLAYEGAKNKSREGFAEFLRLYVTQEDQAREKAPVFYHQFATALKENPDIQDVIVKARMAWNHWSAAPAVEKLSSFIVDGSEGKKKKLPTMNELYTNWKDSLSALQIVTEKARKAGLELKESADPYLLGRLVRGWARKAEQYLKYRAFQLREEGPEITGPSLREILEPIEKKGLRRDLDVYLWAKRGLYREKAIKGVEEIGVNRKVFEQAVKDIEKKHPEVVKAAGGVWQYNAELKQYLVDSGRISQKFADLLEKKDLFYAPLYKLVEDADSSIRGLSRDKLGNLFNPIKRLGISSRDIISPTESLLYNTYAMINVAERNRVGRALIDIAQKAEGLGKEIEEVPFRVKPVKISVEEAVRGLAKELGVQYKDLKESLEDLGLSDYEMDNVITTFRPNYRTGPNEAIFYKDGKPYLMEMAPEINKAIHALEKESLGVFEKMLAYPAKLLRVGATTFSPEFGIRNPARDQLTAFIQSKYGFVPGVDFVRGMFHILNKTELWQKFNISGAAHSAIVSMDRNYLSKNLRDMMREKGGKYFIRHPLETLQIFSELTEEASRVMEFARALKKEGETLDGLLKSGLAGREVTLDFARTGFKGRALNAIIAFWNARLEGPDKMVRTFRERPLQGTMKAFIGVTLPSLLLWYAQHDDPAYEELPMWRKILFWNIITHNQDGSVRHVWSIPKPFEWGILFGSIPEAALDWIHKHDPKPAKEALKQVWETLWPGIVPTGLIPPAEIFANRSYFYDRPIVPRGKEELAEELQYAPHTSKITKLMGRAFSKVPVLKEIAAPAKLQHLVTGYTAGLGRALLTGTDKMLELLKLVDVPPQPSMRIADIPGLRAFSARFPSSNTESIEEFYDQYLERKKKWESQKERAGLRGKGIALKAPAELKKDEQTARNLSVFRKMAQAIYESREMTSAQKRLVLDNIYYAMIDIARRRLGKKEIGRKPIPLRTMRGR